MQIIRTKFKGLFIIKDQTHKDIRGNLKEIYKKNLFKKTFVFSITSLSKKYVLRGLHFQTKNPQGKYISVLNGKAFDVALDLRKKSKTFCKFFTITLDAKINTSVYIPEGFAHGFMSMENNTIVNYLTTKPREPKYEAGILYNDSKLKIKWPKYKKIISNKDKLNFKLKDFLKVNPF